MTWNLESTHNPTTGLGGLQNKFKTSDGNTYGEWEFPEVAPVVFPTLDQLAAQTSEDGVKKKTNMAKDLISVANYWDKRATALELKPSVHCHEMQNASSPPAAT